MKIGIVGSGISGLTCAHILSRAHDVVVYEADHRFGGHANTVEFSLPEQQVRVDTGFIVYNERNYPGFTRLLAELGTATQPSAMSFSVSDQTRHLEWAGTSLSGIFAQRTNAARPQFLRMLVDIARFNRVAQRQLKVPEDPSVSLRDLLDGHRWSPQFIDSYLIPLGASIWSADPAKFADFPATAFLRFCANHGLLDFRDRPAWRTVTGGSSHYVDAICRQLGSRIRRDHQVDSVRREAEHVAVTTTGGANDTFDHVIIATHSDQALGILADANPTEAGLLAAIKYQTNTATLHTDPAAMPRNRRAWASWNYVRRSAQQRDAVLTYDMNRLQNLRTSEPVLVTLNNNDAIDPARVIAQFDYAHPIYDEAAIRAQRRHHEICGPQVSFAGAYWGNGFHEDGLQSAVRACEWLGAKW